MPSARLEVLLLAFAVSGCSNSAVSREGTAQQSSALTAPPRVAGDVAAQQTALLTLELRPDGSVAMTGVATKPIPFRGRRLLPFDRERYQARASRDAQATPEPASYVLLVQPPGPATEPRVVSVELGARGEGGGDVVDRWRGSALLVRAPSFGAGTRYSLLREGLSGPTLLAEKLEAR